MLKLAIGILSVIVCLSSFVAYNSTIDIRNKWKSDTCPKHNEKLMKGRVNYVVGGFAGIQPTNSCDYVDAPYSEGEFPNAKYDYFGSRGCCSLYEYALIKYCKICEHAKEIENP